MRPHPDREPMHRRHERGVVGGVEAIPFGLLIFVAGTLLIASAWAVVDAKMGTDSAAREAARYLVESDGDTAGAQAVGNAAFQNQVGTASGVSSSIAVEGTFVRCARVSVTYSYTTPAVSIPFIGGFGSGFNVSSTHSEIVDPFRGGLGEESQC